MNKKEIIKEIIILLIAFVILFWNIQVYSAKVEAIEPQCSSTTIHYTIDDSYIVFIPESIEVGEQVEISVMDFNVANGKSVVVSFGTFDTDDSIYLHNDNDYEKTVEVCFRNNKGETFQSIRPRIGTFSNGNTSPITFSSYIKSTENAKAGSYSGSVTFDIYCE